MKRDGYNVTFSEGRLLKILKENFVVISLTLSKERFRNGKLLHVFSNLFFGLKPKFTFCGNKINISITRLHKP